MIEELRRLFRALPFGDVIPYGSMTLTFGLVAAALIIELLVVGWPASSARRLLKPSASARRDLWYLFFTATGIITIFAGITTLGLSYAAGKAANQWLGLNLIAGIENPVLQIAAMLLFRSFVFYWVHRVSHTVPALWELHKYHHSATEFTTMTAHRIHPLETGIAAITTAFPLAVVGASAGQIILVNAISLLHVNLMHSAIKWDYGWFSRWIWMSPHAHYVHHSIDAEHFNHNYGTEVVLWDRLFGSLYLGNKPVRAIGSDSPAFNEMSVPAEIWHGIRMFTQRITGKSASQPA